MDFTQISTEQLEEELKKRGKMTTTGRCPTCRGKWSMTYKHYSRPGLAWHCDGCNRTIENCTCSH